MILDDPHDYKLGVLTGSAACPGKEFTLFLGWWAARQVESHFRRVGKGMKGVEESEVDSFYSIIYMYKYIVI